MRVADVLSAVGAKLNVCNGIWGLEPFSFQVQPKRPAGTGAMRGPSSELLKKRFDALLLASASIVWWTNASGEYVEEQPYWEAYTGQSWEEYQGSRWASCVHPDDRESLTADWARAVATSTPYFTQGRIWSAKHKAYRAFQTRGIPIFDQQGNVEGWLGALTDIQDTIDINALLQRTEQDLAGSLRALRESEARVSAELQKAERREEQIRLLMNEVSHRAQNGLTMLMSIARRTWASSPHDFINRFEERVRALSNSNKLLVHNQWQGADLEGLLRSQLGHFDDLIGNRILLQGAPIYLSARAAQALALAVHELSTNAAKHGALSKDDGCVEISWNIVRIGRPLFALNWRERDGPPVEHTGSQGFGSTVLGRMVEHVLGAKASLELRPSGAKWTLTCPLASLIDSQPEKEATVRSVASMSVQGKPRVLIVEDEYFVALEVERILTKGGFAAGDMAADVDDALTLMRETEYDAAVIDVRLADGTSARLIGALQDRGVPFIVLTAYSRDQLPPEMAHAPYLQKPAQSHFLITELRKLLDTDRRAAS